jgi:hypothetical protein
MLALSLARRGGAVKAPLRWYRGACDSHCGTFGCRLPGARFRTSHEHRAAIQPLPGAEAYEYGEYGVIPVVAGSLTSIDILWLDPRRSPSRSNL